MLLLPVGGHWLSEDGGAVRGTFLGVGVRGGVHTSRTTVLIFVWDVVYGDGAVVCDLTRHLLIVLSVRCRLRFL